MIKREKIELTFGRKNRETIEIPNSAIDYLSIANVRLTKKFKNRSCTKFERIKICESLNLNLNKNAINENLINNLLERKDLISIKDYYDDNSVEEYFIAWHNNRSYKNLFQHNEQDLFLLKMRVWKKEELER
mgnify:FL=1